MSLQNQNLSEPALAGRVNELETLHSKLAQAKKGRGATILISGEAGSGKTRLANEFLNSVRSQGTTVFAGWCLSNASVPYFPFVEAFESSSSINETTDNLGPSQLAAKTWLLGTDRAQSVTPQVWKDQTFAAVTRELLFLSSSSPVILFIDDLHWADSASLALLHYISRSILSERILVLATYRSEEVSPNADSAHPIVETLRLMSREDLFEEIHLEGLDVPAVSEIVESMLQGKAHHSLIEELTIESGGLPLFIVESLRMLHEQGGLIKNEEQWCLGVDRYSIPNKVKDVILRRVDSLNHNQRRVLEAASVIGELFDPNIVADVVSQDRLDVLESLETISQSTLLVHQQGEQYKFDHAKSREMLYDKIPFLKRKEYHHRIAQKLELTVQNNEPTALGDLAYHFLQSGNKEKSVKYALAAGNDALARFSNTEAIKHFSYVTQTIGDDSAQASLRILAQRGLGEAYFASSLFKDAMQTFEQIFNFQQADARLQTGLRAMDSAFFQGNRVHLMELVKQAEPLVAEETLDWARVRMNRGRAHSGSDSKKFLNDFEDAQKIFENKYSLPDVARNLIGLAFAQMANGQMEKAVASELRAVILFEELGDSRGLMDACNRAGQVFGSCEMGKQAQEAFDKAIQIGEKIGDFNRLTEAYVSSSWLYEAQNDLEKALTRSEKALECSRKTDSNWNQSLTYSTLTRQYARIGHLDAAETYFNKRKNVFYSADMSGFAQSNAIFLSSQGKYDEANPIFEESIKLLEANQNPSRRIRVFSDYAWALKKQGLLDQASGYIKKAKKIHKNLQARFEYAELQANIMVPIDAEVGNEFEARIDIINVSKRSIKLAQIENLPQEFEIKVKPKGVIIQNGLLDLENEDLDPTEARTIKLFLKAPNVFVTEVKPKIIYVDDRGKIRNCEPQTATIRVTFPQMQLDSPKESSVESRRVAVSLKLEASQKTLDYLTNAFILDLRSRMSPDQSGWRSLMEISKQTKVTKHSLYGVSGKHGKAILELEHLLLVEPRVFQGERGRGGEVLKLRIARENPVIKEKVNQLIGK